MREHLRSAVHALRAHPLRTALTALSMSLGAGAISLMVSLSQSGISTIAEGIEEAGGRHLIFVANKPPSDFKPYYWDRGLPSADADAVRERVPGLAEVAFVLPPIRAERLSGNGHVVDADLLVGSSWLVFMNQRIIAGHGIPSDAAKDASRVTVLSRPIAEALFGSAEKAVGQPVVVFRHRYTVVGVCDSGDRPGFNMDDADAKRSAYFSAEAMIKSEGIVDDGFLILRADESYPHEHVIAVVNAILQRRHHDADDVEFNDFARFMDRFAQIFLGLRLVTGIVAAMSLLIAGAGIMNVLLASVRQRMVEIGVRRALGATQADIRGHFLCEALLIGLLGGIVGSVAGLVTAYGASTLIRYVIGSWLLRLSFGAALVAIIVAALCGIAFGLQPARRAAKLNVVACLRGE